MSYDTTKIVCIFLELSCTTNQLFHFKGQWVYFHLFLFCHRLNLLLMESVCFHTGENSFLQEQTPFLEWLCYSGIQTGSHKLFPFEKKYEKAWGLPYTLKFMLYRTRVMGVDGWCNRAG